jgi:hypothetical protein
VDAARRYVDETPPTGALDYAVLEVDGCGVNRLCIGVNVGQRCAVASVPARETD